MNRTEELIRASQSGDENARETLVSENSGLIWAVVRRYTGRGTETEDLYQLGCLGFLKAVDGFDYSPVEVYLFDGREYVINLDMNRK